MVALALDGLRDRYERLMWPQAARSESDVLKRTVSSVRGNIEIKSTPLVYINDYSNSCYINVENKFVLYNVDVTQRLGADRREWEGYVALRKGLDAPLVMLDQGTFTASHPLHWSGAVPINGPMQVYCYLSGRQVGFSVTTQPELTIMYERLEESWW